MGGFGGGGGGNYGMDMGGAGGFMGGGEAESKSSEKKVSCIVSVLAPTN